MRERPIGVFDSGIGGLTILKALRRLLPREDIIYFGDTARVPYGSKSRRTIIRFSSESADFLLRLGVKMIVAACNTSSGFSLPAIRRRADVPVIGVIRPGAREAAALTKNMRVGIIGTRATISSGAYEREIKKANPKIKVISKDCPLFVPLVEEGWLSGEVAKLAAERYLTPLKKKGVDTLVLGCTHYPLLRPVLRGVLGKNTALVDSAGAAARAVKKALRDKDIRSRGLRKGRCVFYVSDEPTLFARIGAGFLGGEMRNVKKVNIEAR